MLANRVKNRREELKLTQDDLAKKMGYASRSSINKIEKGRPVSQKVIVKLANALEVSPSYLMGWDQDNSDLTFEEKTLIDNFRQLSFEQKQAILSTIKSMNL